VVFLLIKSKRLNLILRVEIKEDKMSSIKKIVLLFVLSSVLLLVGALAKTQHWENLKVLMLVGMALQFGVIVYALILMVTKKK
jgi:hypothetical protein